MILPTSCISDLAPKRDRLLEIRHSGLHSHRNLLSHARAAEDDRSHDARELKELKAAGGWGLKISPLAAQDHTVTDYFRSLLFAKL
jgi:hypothetical protein